MIPIFIIHILKVKYGPNEYNSILSIRIIIRLFELLVENIIFRHILTSHIKCMSFFKFSFNGLH